MTDQRVADEPVGEEPVTDESVGDEAGAEEPVADEPADATGEPYSGVLGAFLYAVRASESVLFKTYAVVGTLLAAVVALLFALALVVLLERTLSVAGGTFTFGRAFFVFVGLLVVGPLIAPTLLVARKRRRGTATARYERAMALTGFCFVGSLYVGLVVSTPPAQQAAVSGLGASLVRVLYSLPAVAGFVPPLAAVGLQYLVHRRLR